jgi:hypothetical protein
MLFDKNILSLKITEGARPGGLLLVALIHQQKK